MKKLKRLVLLSLITIAVIVVVSAQSILKSESEIDVKYILDNAEILKTYCNHYLIIYNNRIIGVLWQNVSLKDVQIGQPWITKWGYKYPLFYQGQYIGQLFITTSKITPNGLYCGRWRGCCPCLMSWKI